MAINTTGHIVRVNSVDAGDLQSIGNIKQKRAIKDYDAVNNETVVQAIGKIKTDPISISVLYDPASATGAGELEAAFKAGAQVPFEIELSDIGTTNGTKFTWDKASVSDFEINPEEDGFVLASFTVTLPGKPTVTAAA